MKAELERLAAEQDEKERVAKVKAEQERLAAEQASREQFSRQQADKERVAKLQAEQERLDAKKAELERLVEEQAEKERVAKVKAEQELLATDQKKRAAFQSGQPLVVTNVEVPQPTSLLLPTAMVVPLSTPSPDKNDVKHISALENHPSYALVVGESSVLAQLDPVVTKLSSAHYQPVITSRRSDSEAFQNSWVLSTGHYSTIRAAVEASLALARVGVAATIVKSSELGE